jgi:LPXTG-motif cell wall-anchored protein
LASTGTAATVTLMTVGTLAALLGALILAVRRRWTAK